MSYEGMSAYTVDQVKSLMGKLIDVQRDIWERVHKERVEVLGIEEK
jgi:hypothetical protein